MKERPILFNTDMVKVILEGKKTQTRRIIKDVQGLDFIGFVVCGTPKENEGKAAFGRGSFEDILDAKIEKHVKPPCEIGDILYIRETWKKYKKMVGQGNNCYLKEFYGYKADENNPNNPSEFYDGNWKPSIHMPKEAARIFLKVTNVRAEKLQDITEDGTKLEGISPFTKDNTVWKYSYKDVFDWGKAPRTAKEAFIKLWDACCSKWIYKWNHNPWVWVIEFELITKD